jgi:hypothetical protein
VPFPFVLSKEVSSLFPKKQSLAPIQLAQLGQRPSLDLANTFMRNPMLLPHVLEGMFRLLLNSEACPQNRLLPEGESGKSDPNLFRKAILDRSLFGDDGGLVIFWPVGRLAPSGGVEPG